MVDVGGVSAWEARSGEDGGRQRSEPARGQDVRARVGAMQILWKCPITDERYVTERAWENANLECCPFHAEGGCGLLKLGTYGRVKPAGVRVPRWWCPRQGESISLLPSFLAARLSGTVAEVEDVVAKVEAAGGVAAAVDEILPPDADKSIGLVGALRWIRRRVTAVRTALLAIVTLEPEQFRGVQPTLAGFREALSQKRVLVTLRELVERHLCALPVPLGFRARARG